MAKMTDMEVLIEDSLDGGPPSVGSGEIPTTVVAAQGIPTTTTPTTTKKVTIASFVCVEELCAWSMLCK